MSQPALSRIDLPGDAQAGVPLLAYAVDGSPGAADIDAVQQDLEGHDRVRLMVRVDRLSMPDAGAFSGQLLSMQLDAVRKVERYALVGGPTWIGPYAATINAVTPFAVRHFDQQADAQAWLSEAPTQDERGNRVEAAEKASPAMIVLGSDRPDLIAVAIDGHLTGTDYDNVADPLIKGAVAQHGTADLLVRIDALEGVGLDAAGDDLALAKHLARSAGWP